MDSSQKSAMSEWFAIRMFPVLFLGLCIIANALSERFVTVDECFALLSRVENEIGDHQRLVSTDSIRLILRGHRRHSPVAAVNWLRRLLPSRIDLFAKSSD